MKALLEAGVHFGHQTRRWNPKMKPYIFQERNGIYIIDLQKTVLLLREVYGAVKQMARDGKVILFTIGTKRKTATGRASKGEKWRERAGTFFGEQQRWLGRTLTNFMTIQKRISRLRELDAFARATSIAFPKKRSRGNSPTGGRSSSTSSAASRTCIACLTQCSSSIRRKGASPSSRRTS